MTASDDSTMAASEAADTSFKAVTTRNKSKRLKATIVAATAVERTHLFTIRVYFPPPRANTKFNPTASMRTFLTELVKHEPSILVVNPQDKTQLIVAKDPLPTNENDFKKLFTVSTDMRASTKQQHIIIRCNMLSERTIREIKFYKTNTAFMTWMKKEKIFIESDSLGVTKTTSIGYLANLHPTLTNRSTLKQLLTVALEDIVIDAKLAVELDPELKLAHDSATANGDTFIPTVPHFEIYKTRITTGRDNDKVKTDIIGIKCAAAKAKLLKEFYAQLASPAHYEKQIGVFVPTGAVHILGATNYANLLRDNNSYLQSVVTIPVGDFQHATLDIPFSLDSSTDIDQTTLQELIEDMPWCKSIERTNLPNKVLILTTQDCLANARDWIGNTLPTLYSQHIADKLDVTTLRRLVPRCLDKPILTAASMAYADKLKLRTVAASTPHLQDAKYAKPPANPRHPRVDMTFAETAAKSPSKTPPPKPASQTTTQAQTTSSAATTASTPTPAYDYKAELQRLSTEIEQTLTKHFEAVFAQMESKLDSWIQKQNERYVEQEKTNDVFTKQLTFLVDNMKRLTNYTAPTAPPKTPSPRGVGKS